MSKKTIISVVMPCFNAEKHIRATIVSIFEQTFSDFELIVVNDGSGDRTMDILNELVPKYPALRIVEQSNRGPAAARNAGLRIATGEFIAFIDSDDTWDREFLATLSDVLVSHREAVLSYCGWQNVGLTENICKPYIPEDYEITGKMSTLLSTCPWPIHAVVVRKAAIDRVGGFDESLLSSEDYDLWLRIAAFHPVRLVPKVMAYYCHHSGEQITKNRLKIALNHWRVQQKFLRANPWVRGELGSRKVAEITKGRLLAQAYKSFWDRDLSTAQALFRKVLFLGYFGFKDLKYILPSLLPHFWYCSLVRIYGD